MAIKNYIITAVICGVVGFVGGLEWGYDENTPRTISLRDVNGDGKADYIVTNKVGEKTVFLEDHGDYTRLDKVMAGLREEKGADKESIDSLEKQIQSMANDKSQ